MKNITQHLRARLLARAGVNNPTSYSALVKTEVCPAFEAAMCVASGVCSDTFVPYMRNRLIMGAMRYGRLYDPFRPAELFKPCLPHMFSLIRQYRECGNDEILVDLANTALIYWLKVASNNRVVHIAAWAMREYVGGTHPNKHWHAVDRQN